MPILKSLNIYGSVMGLTFRNLRKSPGLMLPLFYLALIELVGIAIIYYSVQWPLNLVLAQPIKAFYGEISLHYPFNLVALLKIFNKYESFTEIIFGSLLAGMTISMYNQMTKNMTIRFGKNFNIAFNRYLRLLGYSLFLFIIIYGFSSATEYLRNMVLKNNDGYFLGMGAIKWSLIVAVVNFIFYLVIQILFLYVPIGIIVENFGLWRAAKESIKVMRKYFLVSGLIVALPFLLYLANAFLGAFSGKLMDAIAPEVAIALTVLTVIVVFIINIMINISATILYLNVKPPSASPRQGPANA